MEHERGAFKVKPATSADAVKKWLEIHGFHPPAAIAGLLRSRKYRARILVKQP